MRNWDERDEQGICNADKEYEAVQHVCKVLDIPCRQVNFVKEYWNEVFRCVRFCLQPFPTAPALGMELFFFSG